MDILLLPAVILTAAFVTLSRLLFGSRLAPLGAYSLVWGGCIVLYGLDLFDRRIATADDTLVIIYSSWFAFFLGSVCSIVVYHRRLDVPLATCEHAWVQCLEARRPRIVRLMYWLNGASLLIAIAAMMNVVSALGGIDGYLANAIKLRWEVADPAYHSGIEYSRNVLIHTVGVGVIYVSCVLGAISLGAYKRHFVLSLTPVLAMFIFSVGSISREYLLDVIFIYGAGYWLVQHISGKSSRLLWEIGTKVVMPVFAVIIIMSVSLGKVDHGGSQNVDAGTALAEHFYYRLTVPIDNMDAYVKSAEIPYYAGQATLNPLFRLMYAVGLVGSYVRIDNRGISPLSGSIAVLTYSYLKWPYDDFGLIGPPAVGFVFGFVASLLFLLARSRLSLGATMVCIMLYDAIGYSFATWRVQDIFFVTALVFALLLGFALRCRRGASGSSLTGD